MIYHIELSTRGPNWRGTIMPAPGEHVRVESMHDAGISLDMSKVKIFRAHRHGGRYPAKDERDVLSDRVILIILPKVHVATPGHVMVTVSGTPSTESPTSPLYDPRAELIKRIAEINVVMAGITQVHNKITDVLVKHDGRIDEIIAAQSSLTKCTEAHQRELDELRSVVVDMHEDNRT